MNKALKRISMTVVFGLFLGFLCLSGSFEVSAEAAGAVSVSDIDYEELSMKVQKNGNSIVYLSTDNKKTWNEIEGTADALGNVILDISWAATTSDVKFWLKGDSNKTVVEGKLPKQNATFKVKFDKVNNEFEFSGQEDATYYWWRKSSDYNWHKVSFSDQTAYMQLLSEVEELRFKGGKLILRTGQVKGTDINDMGVRPGKEITVSIPKYTAAPSVKINITRVTITTKTTQEYSYDGLSWHDCEKDMTIEDIAGIALYDTSAKKKGSDVTIRFRVKATESKSCSQTTIVTVCAQEAAPTVGDSTCDVQYYFDNKYNKVVLQFMKATGNVAYEYCIIKPDKEFDPLKVSWKTVRSNKAIKLSKSAVPEGTTIYVRVKGVLENKNKGITTQLPSAYTEFVIR